MKTVKFEGNEYQIPAIGNVAFFSAMAEVAAAAVNGESIVGFYRADDQVCTNGFVWDWSSTFYCIRKPAVVPKHRWYTDAELQCLLLTTGGTVLVRQMATWDSAVSARIVIPYQAHPFFERANGHQIFAANYDVYEISTKQDKGCLIWGPMGMPA